MKLYMLRITQNYIFGKIFIIWYVIGIDNIVIKEECFQVVSKTIYNLCQRRVKCWPSANVVLLWLLENLVLYLIQNTHSGSNKHGSISFMIDNMHYVNFRI